MELSGKRILFLGSSVTYGSASGGVSFVELIAERCGSICVKEAVSGTTLADIDERSYVSRLKNVDKNANFDLFVCQLSTNDAKKKIELQRVEEAIRFIIEYVSETFGCPIIFYTGTKYDSPEYVNMISQLFDLKKEYHFEILDLFYDEEMLKISEDDYKKYMRDPIHPNLLGYSEWWTPKFIEFLKNLSI